MSHFRRFEDIIAWQKARVLTAEIYRITSKDEFAKDFRLSGQIQRASVSIISNIAEGYERDSPNEFHRFSTIRSQLYIALDIGYIDPETFKQLLKQAEEVGRIIGGLRNSIRRT